MKIKIVISVMLFLFTGAVQAGDGKSEVKVNAGADIVSTYVWRGVYNAGASIQPSLSVGLEGFTFGAWGSTDFVGNDHKEIDFIFNYSVKGFAVGITDYWWDGEGARNYFRYNGKESSHRFEVNISYRLPVKKFSLVISWNTIFAGNDYTAAGIRAYSTYIELNYPFSVVNIDMNAVVGVLPWSSPSILPLENKGFSVCNIGLYASRTFLLSENFTLLVYTHLSFNPAIEDVYLVLGVSLSFGN